MEKQNLELFFSLKMEKIPFKGVASQNKRMNEKTFSVA